MTSRAARPVPTDLERALNPKTSPRRLKTLSQSADVYVRLAVAANPNTAPEVLTSLEAVCAEGILQNPALSLHLLVDHQFLQKFSVPMLDRMAMLSDDSAVLSALARHPDMGVRRAAAKNRALPNHMLILLASDEEDAVRKDAVQSGRIPSDVLFLLRRLCGDVFLWSWEPDQKNNMNDAEWAFLDASCGPWAQHVAAQHMRIPAVYLQKAATHHHWRVRQGAALNQTLDGNLLEQLASDVHPEVRKAIAVHTRLPASFYQALAHDESEWVRSRIALRMDVAQADPQIILHLCDDSSSMVAMAAQRTRQQLVLQAARQEHKRT